MWVIVPTSEFCRGNDRNCSYAGTFNPKASSTGIFVNHDFMIRYVYEWGASGDYVTDDLHVAGEELKDVQFGLRLITSSRRGFLGIGYPIREAYVTWNCKDYYYSTVICCHITASQPAQVQPGRARTIHPWPCITRGVPLLRLAVFWLLLHRYSESSCPIEHDSDDLLFAFFLHIMHSGGCTMS